MIQEYGVLNLPPARGQRDAMTGRFLKGCVPSNKGKKWSEYMGKRAQKRASRGWKNIELYRCKGHPNSGRKKISVVAVNDDGRFQVFTSSAFAAKRIDGNYSNVLRCCRLNEIHGRNTDHKYMGFRFYFEKDTNWLTKIV